MAPPHIHITTWKDPVVDALDIGVFSAYVELFWLPVLGPTATFLLRRLNLLLVQHAEGFAINLNELGASLGLGQGETRHAPLPRAIGRCVRFGMAKRPGPDHLAVRRNVATLPLQHVSRLHPALQKDHANFLAWRTQSEASLESL
jgi:hypothetical protein